MAKTIALNDITYNLIKDLALKDMRTMTAELQFIVQQYMSMRDGGGATHQQPDIDVDTLLPPLDEPEPKPVVKKEPWNNDPEYIELKEELKDLNEELEANEDDEEATNDILREMKEIQDKMGEIRKKY